jgi:hypothetical protein
VKATFEPVTCTIDSVYQCHDGTLVVTKTYKFNGVESKKETYAAIDGKVELISVEDMST